MSIDAARELFAATVAPVIAGRLSPLLRPFDPGKKLSKTACFLADRRRLLVSVGSQEKRLEVDRALAYGLAWCGDRDLFLALPAGTTRPTLHRSAFLDAGIRVFAHEPSGQLLELAVPTELEVASSYHDPLQLSVHDLKERALWVSELVAWADDESNLKAAHRPSYLAWHCLGRMVLKTRRAAGGVRVSAGVHAGETSPTYAPLVTIDVASKITSSESAALRNAVERAIADRLSGADTGHQEHLLQARLGDQPGLIGLTSGSVRRELPCVRPGGERAYIDLFGVDAQGDLRVVETKIGDDVMLVLQGLDYYMWAHAHRSELLAMTGRPSSAKIRLDFVVAAPAGKPAIGPYTASQAEVLRGSIPWRFATVSGWQDPSADVKVERAPSRLVPVQSAAPGMQPARYSARLHAHLRDHTAGKLKSDGVSVTSVDDHILATARSAWDDIAKRRLLHRWSMHVRSSQAFAVNLFGPLDEPAVAALLSTVFGPVTSAERPIFEFEDLDDELRESASPHGHRTQVDVLLRGTTANGPVALLVEVKLSEHDFGHCSAAVNPNNDTRHVCNTNGAFGGNPAACFQLRNHGMKVRRRYDEYMPDTAPNPPFTDACWYRGSASQPMRNVALTNVLRRRDRVDARYALCAPVANQAIWQRWDDAIGVLPEDIVIDLPAEQVLAHLPDESVTHMRERYLLDEPRRHDLVNDRESLTWQLVVSLTERYDAPPRVIETHPGGGMYDCITMTRPGPRDNEPRIDINRAGGAHVWIHGELRSMPDAWRQASRVGIDTVADDLALLAELPPRSQKVQDTTWRSFATAVHDGLLGGRTLHWRNGYHDTSGYGAGLVDSYFDAFPSVDRPSNDITDSAAAAYNHWFLLDGETPVDHIEVLPANRAL